MNESKYPKSLSILLALNLCFLLTMLILSMDDIWEGVRVMTGMQSIVMALGLGLIALPNAKGKRRGILGILGMAIAAPAVIFLCAILFADAVEMEGADRRVFTLLSFYASAIPLTFLGLVIAQEGWGANPKSVRRLFLMNIVFLLGLTGLTLDDADAGLKAFMTIQFAMILQTLFLICLPIVRGWRWRVLGLGIMAFAGSILITILCGWVMIERLNLSGSDEAGALVLFVAAIPLNLIALFLLRHGWIAEEAKRRAAGLGNALLALNLLAPIGLYALALGLSDGGSRDGKWLLLVPGWLFAAGLALMFLGRGGGGLPPIKPLRGAGEMSFLAAAVMLSVAFLIGETRGDERGLYVAIGFGLLGFLALHHLMRGFVSRWVRDSVQRFLFKWTTRAVPALIALAVVGVPSYYVIGGWLGERAWEKHKAASEAEGWHYDFADYTGEVPPDDENFFMAKPFSGYLFTQEKGKKPVYHNLAIKEEFEAIVDLRIEPRHRILGRQLVHWADYAQQIRSETASRRLEKIASATDGTDAEVLAAYFAQFDTLFSELREAAKRPKQHIPLGYENALTMFSAYFGPIKSLSQLLNTATLAKLANGNAEGAMADVRLAFRIVEVMSSETNLTGHLVSTAQLNLTIQCLNDGLHMGGWSDAHLAEWDDLLAAQTGLFAKMERATQLERLWGDTAFDQAIKDPKAVFFLQSTGYTKLTPKRKFYEDRIFHDRLMRRIVEHCREAHETGWLDERKLKETLDSAMLEAGQNVYLLTKLLAPPMNKIVHMAGRSVNVLSAARLGVAIERHRQKNGSLPSELSALVPDFIDAIPNDAFTGEQLDWNHKDTFRYSIEVDEESPRIKWIYDPIQTAVETGNLDALKAFAANGWELTKPNADTPESQVTRRRVIDYSTPETVILTQQNALHHAVHSGSAELVQWLIEQGVDTNGTAEIWPPHDVGEMSENGADVFSLSMFDDTPIQTVLEFAVSEERTEIVKMLLGVGVSPLRDTKKEAPIPQDLLGMGMPGLQPAEPPTAIELANAEILPLLLAKVPRGKLTQALGEVGGTSTLQKVLAKREFGKAKRLINSGANVNYTPAPADMEPVKNNPMMPPGAATPGMPPDFMTLFGTGMMGMNPFEAKPVSRLDWLSPVALAAWLGDLDLFQFMIQKGGDLAKVEQDKSTPLHHAAANRDGAILRFILARQPELHTRDESGKSPAACAAQAGRLNNLKLLQQAGAHLDDKAVINAAVRSLNAEMVAHLIGNTRKPLAKNPAWEGALDLLPEVTQELVLTSYGSLGDEQVVSIRKVGALLLDNGLRTGAIQNTGDLNRVITEAQQSVRVMNLFDSGQDLFAPNENKSKEESEAK